MYNKTNTSHCGFPTGFSIYGNTNLLVTTCSNGHTHPMLYVNNEPSGEVDDTKVWDHFRQEFVPLEQLNVYSSKKVVIKPYVGNRRYDFSDEYFGGGLGGGNVYGSVGGSQ